MESAGSSRAASPRSGVARGDGAQAAVLAAPVRLRHRRRRRPVGDPARGRSPCRRRRAVVHRRCSRATRSASASTTTRRSSRGRGSTPTSAPTASTGSATRPTCSTPCSPASATSTALERYTLVDDAWASVLAGDRRGRRVRDPGRALRRRARPVGVGAHRRRARPSSTGSSTATPATRCTAGCAALVGPVRAELGADAGPGEDDRTRTLRGVLLQAAALLGDDGAARDRAAELLDRFLAHPPSVDPSLASPALAVCATLGDVALHERLVAAFRDGGQPAGPAAAAALAGPLPRPRGAAAHARADAVGRRAHARTPPTCWARR